MAKCHGKIGYCIASETAPGVWVDSVTERSFYGDMLRNVKRNENSGGVNDNITLSNQISVVADPFSRDNFCRIKYVKFKDVAWSVLSVEVQYPRLILTLGGVYNGEQA